MHALWSNNSAYYTLKYKIFTCNRYISAHISLSLSNILCNQLCISYLSAILKQQVCQMSMAMSMIFFSTPLFRSCCFVNKKKRTKEIQTTTSNGNSTANLRGTYHRIPYVWAALWNVNLENRFIILFADFPIKMHDFYLGAPYFVLYSDIFDGNMANTCEYIWIHLNMEYIDLMSNGRFVDESYTYEYIHFIITSD